MHVRLKCCYDRFAANPQYIFHALNWIKRNAVASLFHFAENKQFQSEIIVDQSALKTIMQNSSPFGAVSLLIVGEFLQLPAVNQKGGFMKPSKGSYRSFNGLLWEKSQLHELVEIVW